MTTCADTLTAPPGTAHSRRLAAPHDNGDNYTGVRELSGADAKDHYVR